MTAPLIQGHRLEITAPELLVELYDGEAESSAKLGGQRGLPGTTRAEEDNAPHVFIIALIACVAGDVTVHLGGIFLIDSS